MNCCSHVHELLLVDAGSSVVSPGRQGLQSGLRALMELPPPEYVPGLHMEHVGPPKPGLQMSAAHRQGMIRLHGLNCKLARKDCSNVQIRYPPAHRNTMDVYWYARTTNAGLQSHVHLWTGCTLTRLMHQVPG